MSLWADAVTEAIRRVIGRLGTRVRRVALVVPDPVARVALVQLEQVPTRRDDLVKLIEWQVRKGVPFPADEARVSFIPASAQGGGQEFLASVARASVIAALEGVCQAAGLQVGLVDLASIAAINLRLAGRAHEGDWLLVHVRPETSAVAVLRGDRVLFFRSRQDDDGVDVVDFVHQAVMYYQDRLEGRGFEAAYVAGSGTPGRPAGELRRVIEERLQAPAVCLDPTDLATVPAQAAAMPEARDVLTTLLGMGLRASAGAGA